MTLDEVEALLQRTLQASLAVGGRLGTPGSGATLEDDGSATGVLAGLALVQIGRDGQTVAKIVVGRLRLGDRFGQVIGWRWTQAFGCFPSSRCERTHPCVSVPVVASLTPRSASGSSQGGQRAVRELLSASYSGAEHPHRRLVARDSKATSAQAVLPEVSECNRVAQRATSLELADPQAALAQLLQAQIIIDAVFDHLLLLVGGLCKRLR